jgi:Family of unknown function (DUF5994)
VRFPRPADDHHRRTRCLNATAGPDDDEDDELDPLRPAGHRAADGRGQNRPDHPAAAGHRPHPPRAAARPGHARPVNGARQERATTKLTTEERHTATSPAPPSRPRLRLQPDPSARTLLDGRWWPRSADPAAELPGLIGATEERHGPITPIMPGRAGWHASRPRRLRADGPAGSRVVRPGWFDTIPAGLLTATARAGRTDLLTVPPHTAEPAARAAIDQAAQAGNRTRTPALLAAIATAAIPGRPGGTPAGATPDSTQPSTWEWEGGQDGAKSAAGGHIRRDLAAVPGEFRIAGRRQRIALYGAAGTARQRRPGKPGNPPTSPVTRASAARSECYLGRRHDNRRADHGSGRDVHVRPSGRAGRAGPP